LAVLGCSENQIRKVELALGPVRYDTATDRSVLSSLRVARQDLEAFFSRLVVDGDPLFTHRDEGPDDMSAHIRNVLTSNALTIPVTNNRCNLGTWQGVFLWEHRSQPHKRRVVVTVTGE